MDGWTPTPLSHTKKQVSVFEHLDMHVFAQWEEPRAPGENPHRNPTWNLLKMMWINESETEPMEDEDEDEEESLNATPHIIFLL